MNRALPSLAVVIPCRNEAPVMERKLKNLVLCLDATLQLPPVQLVIVDDASEDDTALLAQELCDSLFAKKPSVDAAVISNDRGDGKAGAIASALAHIGDTSEIIIMTDADVILEKTALRDIANSFGSRSDLGMACGSQCFVAGLSDDGHTPGTEEKPLLPAGDIYDHWTARVRQWESRSGKLFSVHGQLLAWRAELNLKPTPGLAADDLDLMLQARKHDVRIEKLNNVHFYELKILTDPHRKTQRIRRAQAYVQFMLTEGVRHKEKGWGGRQWWWYRTIPLSAPWLAILMQCAVPAIGWFFAGPGASVGAFFILAAAWITPAGRTAAGLLTVIAQAQWIHNRRPLTDRWEMARG